MKAGILWVLIGICLVCGGEGDQTGNEIADAEQAYLRLDGSSAKLNAYVTQLEDVYDLMDDDTIVTINEVSYTKSQMDDYIDQESQQVKVLQHQEELNAQVNSCEVSLADGSTVAQYEAYEDCLEDLYDLMDSEDSVTINEKVFSKTGVDEEIKNAENTIEKMKNDGKMQAKINVVEEETFLAANSEDYKNLVEAYEDVIDEMKDQNYNSSQTVEINNEDMTIEDIETKIEILKEDISNMEREENLLSYTTNYETLEIKYVDVYGNIYTTPGLLDNLISILDDIHDTMLSTEMVQLDKESYTQNGISELITTEKQLQSQLDDSDQVRVATNGEYTLISKSEFTYRFRINTQVQIVQTLMNNTNMTADDLFALSQALYNLLDVMEQETSVVLNGDSYSYAQVEAYAQETEKDAKTLKYKQEVATEVDSLNEIYSGLGNYATKSEVTALIVHWQLLLGYISRGDEIEVNNKNYTYNQMQQTITNLQNNKNELSPGKVFEVGPDLELTLINTPPVTHSASLSAEDFSDFIEGSAAYKDSEVIISTNSISNTVLVNGNPVTVQTKQSNQVTNFLQTNEENINISGGIDFHEGSTRFILVTSFIESKSGTGKVFVIPKSEPEDYQLLIEGLQVPVGVCLDINHNYLYVVDKGYSAAGSINQYSIELNKKNLTISSAVVYQIYSGTPSDCKIDSFGNLYFLDSDLQTLNKVLYEDLAYSYSDAYLTLYSSDTIKTYPNALDIADDTQVYFVGNQVNGSLNTADIGGKSVKVLVSEMNQTWGVGVYGMKVVYTTGLPEVKIWDLQLQSFGSFQINGIHSPKGVSVGDGQVFVADYDAGVVFKGDVEGVGLGMFVYVQGAYACYCVNVEDDFGGLVAFASFLVLSLV